MKLRADNKRLTFMSLFLATALVAMSAHSTPVRAQDDVLDDAEDALANSDTLDMDQIDIEGRLSPSELMKRRREKLEERNKVMVEKKIEDIRVKQEIALTNKLQGAFNNSLNNLNEDKVQTVQAAPAPVAPAPVAPAPIIETRIVEVPAEPVKVEKNSKIIPQLGVSSVKGDRLDLETDLTIGLQAETMITPQVSVGMGIGYSTMKMTDVANAYSANNGGYYGNQSQYNNIYGAGGREMSLKKFTIEGNAKYFFTEDSMIKPYIGGGIAFNRSTLKYENQQTYNYGSYNFGNEDYGSSSVGGSLKLGAEVAFNDTVGANIEFAASKNISSGISKSSELNTTYNPDQGRLENVSKEIEDATSTSIQAGLVIKF
ncbi:outer membrane beta-barrel protein [Bacteriovorax sp. PP10]|uniref:Outer membrane beta-barrel protein n=1 Tax=Bacteriovorax antarcticus TaxID=3088717 RepID=A0ABU5W3E8_9BACT|nr:outer membrane beta-barrel protein [Bacteriovorax sp. PP10]MEA9358320.1 outer membrane beta-barrel protein [Bacteriovorax sp. PP10]